MARKIAVGAMISALSLSPRWALWNAYADSCESAMALLDGVFEIAFIYFINRTSARRNLRERKDSRRQPLVGRNSHYKSGHDPAESSAVSRVENIGTDTKLHTRANNR